MTNDEIIEAKKLIADTRNVLPALTLTADAEVVWQKFYLLWEFLRPRLEAMTGNPDARNFVNSLVDSHNIIQDEVVRHYKSKKLELSVIGAALDKIEQTLTAKPRKMTRENIFRPFTDQASESTAPRND